MAGLGGYGNLGMNAGADVHLNAHGGAGLGVGYPHMYGGMPGAVGGMSTGAILVLFILLVIITRTIYL